MTAPTATRPASPTSIRARAALISRYAAAWKGGDTPARP